MLGLKRLHGFLEVTAAQVHNGNYAKWLPIMLKLGEYEMWAMRIKQYFQIQDYALWEVIENGDSWVPISQTTEENGITTSKVSTPATAKEKIKRKNDVKARGLLLMALLNEHQLTFSQYPDAKSMFAAIETRFGGNAATKKTQKTLLKQQYENFSATSAESLDSIFNRLQKIVSRLAILGSSASINDANTAYSQVSAASPSVNTASPQVCTTSVSDNTVYAFMVEIPNGSNVLHQDLEQIHEDDLEAMDLKWQPLFAKCESQRSALSEVRQKKIFIIYAEHRSKEDQFKKSRQHQEPLKQNKTLPRQLLAIDAKDAIDFKIENFDKASKDLDQLLGSQITDKSKKGFGYCAVPPPHPLIYNRPNKLDLSYSGLDEFKEPEFKGYGPENSKKESNVVKESDNSKENSNNKNVSEVEPKKVRKNNDAPIIEDWVSDDEEQDESMTKPEKKTVIPTAAKIEKPVKKSVRSFNHVQRNCTYHQKKKVVSGNNYNRVDNYYYAKTSHHRTHKNVTPRAVLLRTGLKPLSTAKSVYTAHPKPTVNTVRPRIVNTARSYRTPIIIVWPRVINIARQNRPSVNVVRANGFNAAKPSAYWVWRPIKPNSSSITLNRYNYIDARGRSRQIHFDGGYVAFGGGAICVVQLLVKGTLKNANLDIEDVYFFLERHMYSFDMKNIVPKESLTCLVAKATLDESMLWHRRLGHINFKNINKLVKDNLVRGLPIKRFENDPKIPVLLVLKGSNTELLDETSEILKRFIKEIENLVDKKVKIIRSDNGTEFKNKVMDDFCREKDPSYFDSPIENVENGEPKTANDTQKQDKDGLNNENVEQERFLVDSSSKDVNTASIDLNTGSLELNVVGPSVSTDSPYEEDSTEEEPEVDLGKHSNSLLFTSTSTIRILKIIKVSNVIGDVQSTVQTRRMLKPTSEQGFLSDVYEQKTHDTLNTCLYACFLSQIEPTSIAKALSDSSWVEAMQEELLQFKLQQV
ncbi:ribonuclease H-like domain-containing protein [Tanacetum coccineum]